MPERSPDADDLWISELEVYAQQLAEEKVPLDHSADDDLPADSAEGELERRKAVLRLIERVRRQKPDDNDDERPSSQVAPVGTETIGRFKIVRELGRGGSGMVFLAHDPQLDRLVALKVPREECLLTTDLRNRFRREAQAAAALSHPVIVPVYEAGTVGPICYISTQYCDAVSLANWLREREEPVPERQAAAWVAELADAMHHAHQRGVLHRDLKPSNILLVQQDSHSESTVVSDDLGSGEAGFRPRIIDFGLAKLSTSEYTETRTGAILGTPSYMAPEQAEGRLGDVDQRTDVYGLGTILYELLAGHPPLREESEVATLVAVRDKDPDSIRAVRSTLSRDLEAICLKSLEKEPARRYASAAALAEDLRRYLLQLPVVARRPTWIDGLRKWSLRHQTAVWSTMAALLLVSLVLLVTQIIVGRANHDLALAVSREEEAARTAMSAANAAQAAERRSGDLLFAADVRLAGEALANNNVSEARERLERHIPATGEPDRRGFAWHYIWSQLQEEELTLGGYGPAFDVKYSPDGSLLATSHSSGSVVVYRADTGEELRQLGGAQDIPRKLDFSADGELLAAGCDDGRVVVWRSDDGTLLHSFQAHERETDDVAFCHGQQLATAGDRVVKLFQLSEVGPVANTKPQPLLVASFDTPGTVLSIDLTRDGRWLAVAGETHAPVRMSGYLRIWDLHQRTVVHTFELSHKVYCVGFSGSAQFLAAGTQSGEVAVWDFATHEQLASWNNHSSNVYALSFSADEKLLVSSSKDSSAWLWNLEEREPHRLLQGHSARVYGAAVAPSSGQIATASSDGSVRIWRPMVDSYSRHDLNGGSAARFATDGSSVVVLGLNGFAYLHDLRSNRTRALPTIQPGGIYAGWQSSGERVVLAGGRNVTPLSRSTNDSFPRVEIMDQDGDGDPDLVTAFGMSRQVMLQENLGNQVFDSPRLIVAPIIDSFEKIALVDFDGDGRTNVLSSVASAGEIRLDAHEFHKRLDFVRLVEGLSQPAGLAAADLDGDEDLDLVIATYADNAISWLEQDGQTSEGFPRLTNRHVLDGEPNGAARVVTADFSGDGRPDIAAAGFRDDNILLFENLGGGRFTKGQPLAGSLPGPKELDVADVNSDGSADLIAATDRKVIWYPHHNGKLLAPEQVDSIQNANWTRPLPITITVHNAATGEIEHRLAACANFTRQPALSPDGTRLVAADSDHFLRVWELPSGRVLRSIGPESARIYDVQYSHDGRYVLAAIGDDLKIWDAQDFRLVHTIEGHDNSVRRVVVSPDNRLVATVSDDLSARLWSLPEGRQIRVLLGHQSKPVAAAFSPDGRRLATGSESGIVRIWDIVTGQELLVLREAERANATITSAILDLTFRNERTLAAMCYDLKPKSVSVAQWQVE